MSEVITVEVNDHIADVRLNRPEKMNALSFELLDQITEVGKRLALDRSIRAVVLSGNGRSFCAGMDVENFSGGFPEKPFPDGFGGFNPNFYQAPGYVWKNMPVPVICAIQGAAVGGGLQIALGADIRVAHSNSKFSIMEIRWGMIPDMSGSQTLRDLVGIDVAKEMMFTGRLVGADEADRLGLVTYLDDSPYERAMQIAKAIAGNNPDAITYGKYLFENAWHGDSTEGLRMEEKLQEKIFGSKDHMEAIAAQIEGRSPNFSNRKIRDYSELFLD